jgi:sigma-B regulation protein RsbU (phosphoserine phosphatase)
MLSRAVPRPEIAPSTEHPKIKMSRPPRIVVLDPTGARREVSLEKFPLRMGRQADNELVLRDTRVSRVQAQITSENGSYFIEDLGSRHGTFVNGEKIGTRRELKASDQVEFGVPNSYRLVYAGEGASLTELVGRIEAPAPAETGTRELHHLGVLLDVARSLGSGLALEDILTAVVDAAIQVTRTERGVLLLADGAENLETAVARNAKKESLSPQDLQVSMSVVKRVAATRRELIVTDTGEEGVATLDPNASMARLALRTVVAIPIDKMAVIESFEATIAQRQTELLGVLYLDSRGPSTAFSTIDREVMRSLAHEAATVIENARLFASARVKARLDHEIEIASEIQQKLLPRALPDLPGLKVAGFTLACHSVGGDCFDVIELQNGRHGFFVGDVAGKGVSAALLATLLQGVFFTTASTDLPLPKLFSRVNQYLSERSAQERYATVFYGVLEKDGSFEYVNAGHVPPLIRRGSGAAEGLTGGNMPVGLFAEAEYESASVKMEPGEFLVIYSDGVSEAANIKRELFEEERLRAVLEEFKGQTVEELAERIREAVKAFSAGAPQSDDITTLVIQYKGDLS